LREARAACRAGCWGRTPTIQVGRLLFNVLVMVAEFEADLDQARTREGVEIAKAKGRLRDKRRKLTLRQEAHLVARYAAGRQTTTELAVLSVARASVYRAIDRDRARVGA
jgi:DNA invertase Pin-like site-specific DNA recombinase